MKRLIFILTSFLALSAQTSMAEEFSYALKLYQDKFYDLSINELNDYIKKYPNSNQVADANYYLALAYKAYNNNEKALQTFRRTAIDYPKYVKADESWFRVGELLEEQEKWIDAANAFETVKLLYKKSSFAPEALFKSAQNYENANEIDKSMHACRVIIDEYQDSDFYQNARLKLVDLLRKSGKIKEAYVELSSVPENESLVLEIQYQTAKLKFAEHEYESALVTYLEIEKSKKDFDKIDEVYNQIGQLYFRTSDLEKSESYFKKSLKHEENPMASEGLADTYFLKEDYNQAINHYSKSNTPLALFKKSLAYFKLKDYSKAASSFQLVLDNRSNIDRYFYEVAALKRAESLLAQNDLLELVSYINKVLPQINSQEIKMNLTLILGDTHEKRLESDLALSTYNRFLLGEINYANNDRILWRKAMLLEKATKLNEALQVYLQIKTKFPLSPYIDQVLEKLNVTENGKSNQENVLNKFSALLANVIMSDNKAEQFFQLGLINFNDLNNYEASAVYFEKASELYSDPDKIAESLLFKADSYLKLSLLKSSDELLILAQGTYSEVLKMNPSSEIKYKAAEGAIESQLKLIKDEKVLSERAIVYYEAFVKANDTHPDIDKIKMRLSNYYLKVNKNNLAIAELKGIKNTSFKEDALFFLGQIYQKEDSLSQASDYYKQLLFEYPASIKRYSVIKQLAVIEAERGVYENAIAFKKMIINEFPNVENDSYKSDIIEHYLSSGNITEAEKLISEKDVTDLSTDLVLIKEFNLLSFEKFLQLATIFDYKGNDEKAVKYYNEYLRFANDGKKDNDIYFAVSQIYIESNNYSGAIQYLMKISSTFEKYSQVIKNLALLNYRTKDYASSLKYSVLVLPTLDKKSEEYNSFYRYDFISKIKTKGMRKFQKELESYKRIFPKDLEGQSLILFEYAMQQRASKNYNNSIKVLDKLMKDYPKSSVVDDAHYFKGMNYITLNKFNEAIDLLNEFPTKYSYSELLPEYYNTLGTLLDQFQKFEDAIDAYKKSLEISNDPTTKKVSFSHLIKVYNKMGLYESVLSTASTYVQLYPTDPTIIDVKIKIGQAYARLKRGPEAISYFRQLKLIADSEKEPEIQYYIGDTYYRMNEFESAISEYIKIPLLSKKTKLQWVPPAYYYAGKSYENLGKSKDAIRMYEKIVSTVGIDAIFKKEAKKQIAILKKN